MDKYEFRLCDAVADSYLLLSKGVTSSVAGGLSSWDTAVLLNRMFNNRELFCFEPTSPDIRFGLFERLSEAKLLYPSVEQLVSSLEMDARAPTVLWYGLGPNGAEEWEKIAKPRWDEYLEYEEDPFESDPALAIHVLKGRRTRVELARSLFPFSRIQSEQRESLVPWHATYWRTLDEGCQLTIIAEPGFSIKAIPETPVMQQFLDLMDGWYEFPEEFKSPGYWNHWPKKSTR